jgi:hypothetical protein
MKKLAASTTQCRIARRKSTSDTQASRSDLRREPPSVGDVRGSPSLDIGRGEKSGFRASRRALPSSEAAHCVASLKSCARPADRYSILTLRFAAKGIARLFNTQNFAS